MESKDLRVYNSDMTIKQIARQVIDHADDDCSMDEIINDLRLQQSLEISRHQSKAGQTRPLEEVEKEFSEWIKQPSS